MTLLNRRKIRLAVLATTLLILSTLTAMLYYSLNASTTTTFASNPNPQSSGPQSVYTPTDWLNWAKTAWNYFQPGVGVNANTGLDRSTLSYPCAADWDQGGYIYAIIFARKLNLIGDNGAWQFNDRVSKILNFLSTRQLSSDGYTPFWAYDWDTTVCAGSSQLTNPTDSGRLLGALNALRVFSPSYASQINSIFLRSKPAYDSFATSDFGGQIYLYYAYLVAQGYAAFGYDESSVFNSLDSYSGHFYSSSLTYGQNLPQINSLSEPLNLEILGEGTPSSTFLDFANRVYLTQEGRWSASGNLTAWSEGVYLPGVYYVYEWVLFMQGGQTSPCTTCLPWVLRAGTSLLSGPQYPPLAYTKTAFSYLAIYGENPYTLALVGAVKSLASSNGFGDGVFENGTSPLAKGKAFSSAPSQFYSDKTNMQVLEAAFAATSTPAQITFFTSPTSSALISWNSCSGPAYGSGQSILSAEYGTVTVCYVPSGYTLSSWTCAGGLSCSGSSNPTTVTFTGAGSITLNLKVGSLSNPISTSLTASPSPANPTHGTSFTVSGTLTANGAGLVGEQIVLVFGWNLAMVTVTTLSGGSYSYAATAPSSRGSYNVQVFFLGDLGGSPQYTPSTATAAITVT